MRLTLIFAMAITALATPLVPRNPQNCTENMSNFKGCKPNGIGQVPTVCSRLAGNCCRDLPHPVGVYDPVCFQTPSDYAPRTGVPPHIEGQDTELCPTLPYRRLKCCEQYGVKKHESCEIIDLSRPDRAAEYDKCRALEVHDIYCCIAGGIHTFDSPEVDRAGANDCVDSPLTLNR